MRNLKSQFSFKTLAEHFYVSAPFKIRSWGLKSWVQKVNLNIVRDWILRDITTRAQKRFIFRSQHFPESRVRLSQFPKVQFTTRIVMAAKYAVLDQEDKKCTWKSFK